MSASRHRFLVGAALLGPPGAFVAQAMARGVAGQAPELDLSWFALISALVLAPVLEELVFRGGLQTRLERITWARAEWLGCITAANVLTSAAFATAHLAIAPAGVALATFLPSLVFGRLQEVYEPWLVPAMGIHALYNLCFLAAGFAWAVVS